MSDELVKREERAELAVPDASNLLKFSDAMARSSMFPAFKDKWQVAAAVQLSISLGIDPMIGLMTMAVVKGRVCVEAKILQAQLEKHGVKITIIESNDKIAKVKFKKTGKDAYTETFTIEEAQRKGLLNKDNWRNWPGEMLYYRCISRGGRKYDPAAIFNLYSIDETEEIDKKPIGKTLKVSGAKVEEVKEFKKEYQNEPIPSEHEEEVLEGEVVEEAEEKPKAKPKPRARKKAEPKPAPKPEPTEEEPQDEEEPEEKSQEPAEETTEAEAEQESGPDHVAAIKEALSTLWGKNFEDHYKLFKTFLFGFQDEREPKRHFVGKNEFHNLSFTCGKNSDHAMLIGSDKAWTFTLKQFENWKTEKGVKTYKEWQDLQEGADSGPY